jgi:hypothetical protein
VETDILRERVRGRSLVTSRVVVVEVTKAVARANPAANVQAVLARLAFVELDTELARVAAATGDAALRALDAIQLASALRLDAEIVAFVTYDDRQTAAARNVGLALEAPGPDRPGG